MGNIRVTFENERKAYWCLVGNGYEWMGLGEWDDY